MGWADGSDDRVPAPPTTGKQAIDGWAFTFIVGANQANRLIQQHQNTVGVIERFTIDRDGVRFYFDGGIFNDVSLHGYAHPAEPSTGFTAGAISQVGEELVEAAFHGWRRNGSGQRINSWLGNPGCR